MPGPHIHVQEDRLVSDELMGGLNDAPYGPPPHGLPLTISLTLTMNPNPHPYMRERLPVLYSWREGVESKLAAS